MDNLTVQPPSSPSPLPKILLVLLFFLVITIISVFIFIKKPFNPFQKQISSPSIQNIISFSGTVQEKGKDFLILKRGDKTLKVIIKNETKVDLMKMSELSKNPNFYSSKSPNISSFAEIKVGSNVGALGEGNDQLLNAKQITIFQ